MSCVISIGSLQPPNSWLILPRSFSMSSKRISSMAVRLAQRSGANKRAGVGCAICYDDAMARTISGPVANRWQQFRLLLQLPKLCRLCWRLLCDARVALWVKAIPVAAVAYAIMPFDLIPDI